MRSNFTSIFFHFGFIALLALPLMALSTSSEGVSEVNISDVKQRWPWNNKLDISYEVKGGQTRSAGVYCGIRFNIKIGGVTRIIEGYEIGASAENGKHTVTWDIPSGIKANDCSLSATLYATNFPSGNDYMIVDLVTGKVHYEGLLSDPSASNARYNNDPNHHYKTDKLVLRKVPRTSQSAELPNGPFPDGYKASGKNWKTNRDFYVGVFPVTQQQYVNLVGVNPVSAVQQKDNGYGDIISHRPVANVSWDQLRTVGTPSSSSIPLVFSNEGTFLQRLTFIAGNKLRFDLPTELMSEISHRAGTTTEYFWGDTPDAAYYWGEEGYVSPIAVGSRLPNNWGLYDVAGNVWEWCLDERTGASLSTLPDVFTPLSGENITTAKRRNAGTYDTTTVVDHKASKTYHHDKNNPYGKLGFRVAVIPE